jgi:diaminopimelate decarboxylase
VTEIKSRSSRQHLKIQNGSLFVDGVSCKGLAEEFDTPLYVLSQDRIRENYRAFHGALTRIYPHILICPAYKANSHSAVCRLYEIEGAGAEVVSPAELRMALDAGVNPEKIVYNGPMKKEADLELAIESEVGLINADSIPELEHMQRAASKVGKRCNAGLRINVGIAPLTHPHLATAQREHKFGIWIGEAIAAYTAASKKPELNMIGMHCHIGSNISEPKVISEMARKILGLAIQVKKEAGVNLSKIDMGGGVGYPYQPDSPVMTFEEYATSLLTENIANLVDLRNPTLIFEPGRALAADAGILLTTVNVLKRQGDVNWAIVDAGMNAFIRPALYDAKHQILLANRDANAHDVYSVGGPCCESADAFARGITLPTLLEGDLLAVLDAGAYGYTMASNYNGQPRPAVVLVAEGKGELIRRRDSYEDMMAGEIVPAHLAHSTLIRQIR